MRTRRPEKQTDAKQVITSVMDATEGKQREPRDEGATEVPFCTRVYSSLAPGAVLQPPASESLGNLFKAPRPAD